MVMLYKYKLGPHAGKLKLIHVGPILIKQVLGQGTFLLADLSRAVSPKPVNGFRLKKKFGKNMLDEDIPVQLIIPVGQDNMMSIRGRASNDTFF